MHVNNRLTTKQIQAGASLATHVMNALPEFIHRHHNSVFPLLARNDISCCIIADGEHVPPCTITTILRAKGISRIILTSDVSPAAGLPDGEHMCFGNRVRVTGRRIRSCDRDGLAGSGALMIDCANFMFSEVFQRYGLNLTLHDIEEMTFHAPLRAIGIDSSMFVSRSKNIISYDSLSGKFVWGLDKNK